MNSKHLTIGHSHEEGTLDEVIREGRYAQYLTDRAEAARAHQRHHEYPRVAMRRIELLEATSRRSRRHGRDSGSIDEEITYWRNHLAELEATSEFVPWKPEHFQKGDHVLTRHGLWSVIRVNKKSLTVPRIDWSNYPERSIQRTETIPYDRVLGRRRNGQQLDTPNGDEYPVANPDA